MAMDDGFTIKKMVVCHTYVSLPEGMHGDIFNGHMGNIYGFNHQEYGFFSWEYHENDTVW
jgi:hypothetical protein